MRESNKCKCTYRTIDSHTTYASTMLKCAQEGGNNSGYDKRICFQCRLRGHVKVNCVPYNGIKEWSKVKRAIATAALATTGDCDPL